MEELAQILYARNLFEFNNFLMNFQIHCFYNQEKNVVNKHGNRV
jgi:hypothetical protein